MKNLRFRLAHCVMLPALLIFLALTAVNARADFNLSVSLDRFGSPSQNNVTYAIFLSLTTTNVPITYYEVYSPHSNSFNGVGNGSSFNVFSLPDFNALVNELTNGNWKLILNAGDPSQQIYTFTVSLNGFNSNAYPFEEIFNPPYGATDVATNPVFAFTGPADYQSLGVFLDQGNNFFDGAGLPPDSTNWTSSQALSFSTAYDFIVQYSTDASSEVLFTTPTNGSQTLPGWSTSVSLNLQDTSHFTTVANTLTLQEALDATNLTWSTSGDAPWFAETNVTFDGVSAAQSGVLLDEQMSVLQTTVTGPGTLSFYWQTTGEDDEFDLEFDDNGNSVSDITSQTFPWIQFSYRVTSGTHTLTWTAMSGDGSSTNDAGFLDEVSFVPDSGPPPPLGTWAATGSLPVDVSGPGEFPLTLLGNGTVLASGGLTEGFPEVSASAANLYNPATGTWTNTGFMNTDRRQHTATLLPSSGKVLVAGGISGTLGSGGVTDASAELYDTASGTWTNTGSMHTARADHAAALLANGSVLVAGGLQDTSSELYSPTNGTWATTGPLNELRFGASAITLSNGQVLIVGGANDNTAELYDPSTRDWTYANNLLAEQENATATLLADGTVLVAGGFNADGQVSSFAEIYNPTTGSWTQTGTMNTPRAGASAVLLANGVVLVAGGDGASGALADAELYYPLTGQWTSTGSMLTSRDEFVSALLPDGRVLATGGFDSTAELYTTVGTVLPVSIILTHPIVLPGGSFQFSFTNTPGSTNIVFATTNLTASFSTWQSLGAAPEGIAGHFQFTDSTASNFTARFYRVGSP